VIALHERETTSPLDGAYGFWPIGPSNAAARAVAAAQKKLEALLERENELATVSNAVVDLLHAGKLIEVEQAARELLVRFPDVHDGYDRLGMVYEARGGQKQAANCYREIIGRFEVRIVVVGMGADELRASDRRMRPAAGEPLGVLGVPRSTC